MIKNSSDRPKCPNCNLPLYKHGVRLGNRRWVCRNHDYSCTEKSNRKKLKKAQKTTLAIFKGIFESASRGDLDFENIWEVYAEKPIPKNFKITKYRSDQEFKGSGEHFIVSFVDNETIEIYTNGKMKIS